MDRDKIFKRPVCEVLGMKVIFENPLTHRSNKGEIKVIRSRGAYVKGQKGWHWVGWENIEEDD